MKQSGNLAGSTKKGHAEGYLACPFLFMNSLNFSRLTSSMVHVILGIVLVKRSWRNWQTRTVQVRVG